MNIERTLALAGALFLTLAATAQPSGRKSWNEGWTFTKDGVARTVTLPHDWGVEQPFLQENPGESGKLAWWGQATYTKILKVTPKDLQKDLRLEVDGAFSNAVVYVNGQEAGGWPYGYASWAVELTPYLTAGNNVIEITLDNKPESSRWYPGGGLYRNVWLTATEKTAVAHWGSYITTELLADGYARVTQRLTLKTDALQSADIHTVILYRSAAGEQKVAEARSGGSIYDGKVVEQTLDLLDARLWSPETPNMYVARTTVEGADGGRDVYETPFGIRSAEFRPDGFYLNGNKTFMKGVCLHHDAGALGAAWNDDAWTRRLTMLKKMGCNAIRTSHNPPAPELLDLCDRMGFLVMDEFTDTWTLPKKENGYATLFEEWAEKDLVAMIHRDRNHPSVVLWSIGNECNEQGDSTRWNVPRMLTDICHREDPTRPTTAGNNFPWAAFSRYADTHDVFGFNYKPFMYKRFAEERPAQPYLGSETASCISTRGYYLFPVEQDKSKGWLQKEPWQVSSYDLYAPAWASSPDFEWQYQDEAPNCAGEFVWTGYDYLGEPTPFEGPSRSSYFGIIDLAGFPKDRYWLYQSRWAPEVASAHILPHWTWPGREGKVTPVHVYSSGDEAELFVNGVSQGRQKKNGYRFVWADVRYKPGTVEVVVYKAGKVWAREKVRTAGAAFKLAPSIDYKGKDLTYVTVDILDRNGVLVPDAATELSFSVQGPAKIVGTDAGDPTSHVPFYSTTLPAFHGKASAIVKRTGQGPVTVTVTAKGFRKAVITL